MSLTLYCFSPDILAHGSLYTTDLGLAAFFFFSVFALKRFFDQPSASRAVFAGILCGLTFVTKISGLALFPITTLLFILFYATQKPSRTVGPLPEKADLMLGVLSLYLIVNALGQKQAMVTLGPLFLLAAYLCLRDQKKFLRRYGAMILKGFLIVCAALSFFFAVKLKKKYGVEVSMVFLLWNAVAAVLSLVLLKFFSKNPVIHLVKLFLIVWLFAGLTIILDYTDFAYKCYRFIGFGNFVKPLGIVLSHSMGGHRACVEGSFVTCDWRYFFGTLAVKMPLLPLGLAGLGLLQLVFSRRSLLFKSLVILPPAIFLGIAVFNGINIGVRHILPVYPFLFLLGGFPAVALANMKPGVMKKTFMAVLAAAIILFAGRTFLTAPHYLSYFNEAVGGSDHGARLVAGSSLDWGQDNRRLAEFVRDRKIPFIKIVGEAMNADIYDFYKISWAPMTEEEFQSPAPGYYALGIVAYAALQKTPDSWFCGKMPAYRVGKTYYVFEVPGK